MTSFPHGGALRLTAPLLLLALAACSDPEATGRYLIEPPAPAERLPNRLGRAELREVSLPDYAAGQEITWQTGDGALRSRPDTLWADDPARGVTQALAGQIAALTGGMVAAEPWPLADAPDRRVEVRVTRMLAGADGLFRLAGSYFVSSSGFEPGRDIARRFDIATPLTETGPAAIAAAQSAAIHLLARQIARLE